MHYELLQKPDFTLVKVVFQAPGEQLLAESAAMVAKDPGVEMQTQMRGGLLAAAKRKMLGGESIFQHTFPATAPDQRLYLAPGPEGDVEVVESDGRSPIFLATPGMVSDLLVGERRRATLDILLTTPLRPTSIILGKLLSRLALLWAKSPAYGT